jgi:hypothetical protein
MNNTQLNQTNQNTYNNVNNEQFRDIDPLAMLFFFLGALHIYTYLRRTNLQAKQKIRPENSIGWLKINQMGSLTTLALLGLIIAGAIELYQVYS